jgi:hypothetical protein
MGCKANEGICPQNQGSKGKNAGGACRINQNRRRISKKQSNAVW